MMKKAAQMRRFFIAAWLEDNRVGSYSSERELVWKKAIMHGQCYSK